ncbi:hypothetical protein LTR17_004287 [Elasticomyces elasticus]|nr:hypothetical protein LTR17_004287 [Elasticomyces elasticus]
MAGSADSMDDSPLLRLPPEIREQIFKYALGGNVIHFAFSSRATDVYPRAFLCQAAHVLPRGRNESMLIASHSDSDLGHKNCDPPGVVAHRMSLELLRSCRQINKEAGLLPFSENTFLFSDDVPFGVLARLLAGLNSHQAGAIRNLAIVCMYPIRSRHRPEWPSTAEVDFIVQTLHGLKDLQYVVELARQTHGKNYIGESLSRRQGLAEGILMFRNIQLRSFEVRFCYIPRIASGAGYRVAELEAFGRALEEDIIKQMTVERGPT